MERGLDSDRQVLKVVGRGHLDLALVRVSYGQRSKSSTYALYDVTRLDAANAIKRSKDIAKDRGVVKDSDRHLDDLVLVVMPKLRVEE